MPIRVLLVDDNAEFLDSASRFLSAYPQIEVIGSAMNGTDGVRLAESLAPDVVLMDWAMLDIDGLQATRQIKARPAAPKVVLVTFFDEEQLRTAASAAGVDGFVGKGHFGDQLIPLVESLAAGSGGGSH